MKYLKHYWISLDGSKYFYEENPVLKRHPELEFPGLDVKIWMHDQNGIDVCLSAVPDTTEITDVYADQNQNLKVVQQLTEEQFNSVFILIRDCESIIQEKNNETNEELIINLEGQLQFKMQEAKEALFSL